MELQISLDTMRRVYGVTTDAQLAVRARSDEQAAALGRRIEALVAAATPASSWPRSPTSGRRRRSR